LDQFLWWQNIDIFQFFWYNKNTKRKGEKIMIYGFMAAVVVFVIALGYVFFYSHDI
jgi:hypothetical protein